MSDERDVTIESDVEVEVVHPNEQNEDGASDSLNNNTQ